MSDLYGPCHRQLQDEDGSTLLADRLEAISHEDFAPEDREFIASASMFFLSTVDHKGRPTVSYKGGAPGFVRIMDDGGLAFSRLRRQRHDALARQYRRQTRKSVCSSSTSQAAEGCACRVSRASNPTPSCGRTGPGRIA